MAVWLNDAIRGLIKRLLPLAGRIARRELNLSLARYPRRQAELRALYGITDQTPILDYAGTRPHLEAFAAGQDDVFFAETSGSTGDPKRIPYTPDRVRRFKVQSRDAGLRAFVHFGAQRPELFVFAGLQKDRSFSSLVLHDGGAKPGYLAGLTEPARYLRHPAVREASRVHGTTAARVFLLALSNPCVLYSTNPSTLAVFLTEVQGQWPDATGLVRAYLAGRHPKLDAVIKRVGRAGWRRRFVEIDASTDALPLHRWAPDVHAFCCWDGGYVGPFLAQIRRSLPHGRYVHIPMYAMSTETVETLPARGPRGLSFLPISADVLYEFLPVHAPDDAARLRLPSEVAVGDEVCMVVSDRYGLRRYQTEDVFECVAKVGGLPDLRFRRRRGLTWSFTGEKLTAAQLSPVFDLLREQHPSLSDVPLSCLPSQPAGGLPGYVLLAAAPNPPRTLASDFDAALSRRNGEYRDKRASGRLAPPRVCGRPYPVVAAALGGPQWESQFKLAPLTKRLFESLSPNLD